jgi:hypothetical protein
MELMENDWGIHAAFSHYLMTGPDAPARREVSLAGSSG